MLFDTLCYQGPRQVKTIQDYWSQFSKPSPRYTSRNTIYKLTTPMTTRTTTTTTTTTTTPVSLSPHSILSTVVRNHAGVCGVRSSEYMPHYKKRKGRRGRKQLPRRGRVVWDDDDSMGSSPAPSSTFPWMAGLFMLIPSSVTGEALFMCAGAVLTPNIVVTAAHCFTGNANNPDLWFVRVGDNYILKADANEQTFRVKKIIRHSQFDPLRDDGGDGRNDIAILVLQSHNTNRNPKRQSRNNALTKNTNQLNGLIAFSKDVRPICAPPQQDYPLNKLKRRHCEIAGWGMTEYNNSASYPDSIRAARITVGNIPNRYCDYLYKRNVKQTGKFCAGGKVDACQEDSGGPLVCKLNDGKYHFIGIVSSGKGCGVYPGLYTEVSRYIDWLAYWVTKESIASF